MAPEPAPVCRYGAAWGRAVLRPFAEQLLAALRAPAGGVVRDLSDDDGITAALLRRHGFVVLGPAGAAHPDGAAAAPVDAVVALSGGMEGPPAPPEPQALAPGAAPQTLLCSWASAPHEEAVRAAFGLGALHPAATDVVRWPDVVRFDTSDHLWAAVLARADVVARSVSMSAEQLGTARRLLDARMSAYLTADAGLRIPAAMGVRRR